MTIETTRLKIQAASREEMLRIIECEMNDVLKKAYQEMLQGCLAHPEQWEWYAIWTIESKDGFHVGDLSFKGLNDDGSVEIGYSINEMHQGQGYATEAVKAFLPVMAEAVGTDVVHGICLSENAASKHVLLKCGFDPVFEGIGDYQGEKRDIFRSIWKSSK